MLDLYNNKIAVVSDIHAGVHQNSLAWYSVMHKWADWFVLECKKNNIRDIVIPGDVFHHRNEINVHTIHNVYKLFKKFEDFNVIVLVGNHDAYYKNNSDVHSLSFLNEWENVTVVDTVRSFTAFGKKITICPWGTTLEQIPNSDIIFGHFELQGFCFTKNKVCTHGFSSREILEKAPLVITGHFHLRDDRTYDNGRILYTGSAYELDWGDCDSTKGYYLLNVEDGSYTFVENTITPKHKKIFLSTLAAGITPAIKEAFAGNWVKLFVDRKIQDHKIDLLISKLNGLNPLSIHVEFALENSAFDGVDYEYEGIDVNDCIKEYVEQLDIDHKQEVINYVLDLYKRCST